MKWKNHAIVAGSFLYALGLEPGAIALGTASAVLPDRIETPFGPAGLRLLRHRGWSHELMLWLIPCVALLLWNPIISGDWALELLRSVPFPIHGLGKVGALDLPLWAIPLGGVLHLLLGDLLTPGGVTIWGEKFSLNLFRTGTRREYAWTGVFVVLCLCYPMLHLLVKTYLQLDRERVLKVVMIVASGVGCLYGLPVFFQMTKKLLSWRKARKQPEVFSMADLKKYRHSEKEPSAENNAEPEMQATPKTQTWKTNEIQSFVNEEMVPRMDMLQKDEVMLDAIYRVLKILDEEGGCPSVGGADGANLPSERYYKRLRKISLRSHSLNVARIGHELLKKRFDHYRIEYGAMLMVYLGHDVGKIERYHKSVSYSSADHPIMSARVIGDLLAAHPNAELVDHLRNAVAKHHEILPPSATTFHYELLRNADKKAREVESAKTASVREPEEFVSGLHNEPLTDECEEIDCPDYALISPPEDTVASQSEDPQLRRGQVQVRQETGNHSYCPPNSIRSEAQVDVSVQPGQRSVPVKNRDFRPVEVFELPDTFPIDVFLKKLRRYTNYVLAPTSNLWKSVSQPDGYVYFCLDLVDEMIKETADEVGLVTPTFMSDDRQVSRNRLVTIYRLLRAKGWAHSRIGDDFHSREFIVNDRRTNKEVKMRLMAISAEALGAMPGELEAERKGIPRLQFIKIK